ncbi:hypothetical protein MCOR25_003861 [Pyricularia grisea]|uniref:Non-homologous end-joining factor 1 n=1 Tax=Pyricularia grisea TaxID=148305 RepID=A0A6P8B8T0_PYRGI|nr:uncharacterized protein PgNI_03625 [Pyricularia grisea]KAI6371832.1 hypothetical protein MCOR25_003861 [Pyricularia grisea]TLD12250.1 hypothetical protein PgNI_03625 [Pyricularia grisea]
MTPEKHASWRPLPVSHPAVPNLLVSAAFSTSPVSYSVYITDLANVWLERLDRREILLRSLEEKTSIDPCDDPENFKELLHRIGSAFDAENPHHANASLALTSGPEPSTGGANDLILEVTCILPAGLQPLRWPIKLSHGGASAVATELVLPLVQAQMARQLELETLLSVIKEKDSVIAKVLDKLDTMGARLDQIFPALAASGKRKITREFAESRVKGLAPYDEDNYLQQIGSADGEGNGDPLLDGPGQPKDVQDLVKNVFGGGSGLRHHSSLDYSDSPALNNWWKDLGEGSGKAVLVERNKSENRPKGKMTPSPGSSSKRRARDRTRKDEEEHKNDKAGDDDYNDNDDDFEVQATPPHLMSARKQGTNKRKSPQPTYDDDASTASEADDDFETQIPDSNPPPETRTPTKPKVKTKSVPRPTRLGTIGKKKQPEPEPEPEPEVDVDLDAATESGSETGSGYEEPAESISKDDGSETASDAEDPSESELPSPKTTAKAKRGGLGRIGGLGKAKSTSKAKDAEDVEMAGPHPSSKTAADEDDTESDRASARPGPSNKSSRPVKRLGVIGDKGAAKQQALGDGIGDRRGRPESIEESKEPATRETSEERANRRREELQQQLAKKAAQGPVRKKRKF